MKKFNSLLVILSVLIQSPVAFSQSYNYSGRIIDLNNVYDPPASVHGDICDRQFNSDQSSELKACYKGVNGADSMAQKYAVSAGEYLGCIDGYYQGIWDGYMMSKNPTPEMIQRAKTLFAGVQPVSAQDRAEDKADRDSTTVAADQIIKRYRSVIGRVNDDGSPMLPDKSYQHPEIRFRGFTDGYTHDLSNGTISGGDFRNVYNAGWVKPSDTFERRSAARKIHQLQESNRKYVCDNSNTIFGRKKFTQLRFWDFWRANRKYNFERYGWSDANWAFNFFTQDQGSLQAWKDYNGIAFWEEMVEKQELVKPAVYKDVPQFNEDGTPKLGADGKQIVLKVLVSEAVYRTIRVPQRVSSSRAKTLKAIYERNFKLAYGKYYARKHASRSYHTRGMSAYTSAKTTGMLIGESVARTMAERNEYNNRYQAYSLQKYAEKLKDNYERSFDTMIDKFEKHSIVELNNIVIEGDEIDGIFRPGEGLRAKVQVTNLGETLQDIELRLKHTGDIQAGVPFNFAPDVLKQTNHHSGVIGNINLNTKIRPSLGSDNHTQLNATLALFTDTNISDIQTVLNTSDSQRIQLNEIAEIKKVETGVNLLSGTLDINVVIENASDLENTALPKVIIKLDDFSKTNDIDGPRLAGGEIRTVPVPLNSVDPLVIIKRGNISGIATSKMNGRVLDQRTFKYSVGDYQVNLLNYYHALSLHASGVNTGSQSRDERINSINGDFLRETERDIARRVNWKNGSQVASTVIGKVVDKFTTSQADGSLTQTGKASYAKLARKLAPLVGRKGKGRKVKGKKDYLKLLNKLDPSLSTKPRAYK